MIALMKYGSGVPFNRLQRLQGSLAIPLPAATQWEIAAEVSDRIDPVFEEIVHIAAQGRVLHNDDTTMKVLELCRQHETTGGDETPSQPLRKGVFTSGIMSVVDGHRIALFFTGQCHADENLAELLKQRHADLQRPIQMCDALSRNAPDSLKTILGNCLTHGRRRFVEVAANFPDECLYGRGVQQDFRLGVKMGRGRIKCPGKTGSRPGGDSVNGCAYVFAAQWSQRFWPVSSLSFM